MAQVLGVETPVAHAADLRLATAFYRDTLGFEVRQQIPSVAALLSLGFVTLQLWQRDGLQARACQLVVPPQGSIFELHARIARRGRTWIEEPAPVLRSWGDWEFIVRDCCGNRLHFREQANASALDLPDAAGNPGRVLRP